MAFPRISISGTLILAIYITTMKISFDKSFYGTSFRSGDMVLSLSSSSLSIFVNSITMSTSLLNVISHSVVVLGALNDTYVLSILVGVGFDVLTRIIQLIWWIDITRMSFFQKNVSTIDTKDRLLSIHNVDNMKYCYRTIVFCSFLVVIHVYQMIIHVRALRMNCSYKRLKKVLTGALNNLRGIPGEGYYDHLFAYSDLGGHLLPFILSTRLLLSLVLVQKMKDALLLTIQVLAILLILSYLALSRIPVNEVNDTLSQPLIRIGEGGTVICNCDICSRRTRRKNITSSFTFNVNDGACRLWLCSFEKLSTFLNSAHIVNMKLE